MGGFNDHPGGGFTSVKGYNDPAGSQAEADRLAREAAQAREREAQRQADADALARANEAARRASEPPTPARARTGQAFARAGTGQRGAAASGSVVTNHEPAQTWQPTSTGRILGLAAFVIGGAWGASLVEGEYWWIASLAIGVPAAYVGARYYVQVAMLVLLAGGAWLWDRIEGNTPATPTASESPALPPQTSQFAAPAATSLPPAASPPLPAGTSTTQEEITHTFTIDSGLVASATPPAAEPMAPASAVFQEGDVLAVKHRRAQFADTLDEFVETTIRHRVGIDNALIAYFEADTATHALTIVGTDGSRWAFGPAASEIYVDAPVQQIRLVDAAGTVSQPYEVRRR